MTIATTSNSIVTHVFANTLTVKFRPTTSVIPAKAGIHAIPNLTT